MASNSPEIEEPHGHVFIEDVQGMFRSVLDHMPSRIFWKDTNLHYLGCNLAFAQDAGFSSPEEIVGKTDYEMGWTKEDAEKFRADDRKVLDTGKGKCNFEECQTRSEGDPEWLETTKRPLHSADGELVGVLGTYQIITERKQAEFALLEAREAAEAANQTKSEFLATMSHEIRSPLNVLLGYTDLLRFREQDSETLEMLELMSASGQCLREIIDDILDLSKIESQEVDLQEEPFNPEETARRQFDIMANQATERGLNYTIKIDPGVPSNVISDAPRWSQIIRNLLSNAIKFTPKGSVELHLSAVPAESPEGNTIIKVTVTDTGIGITEETAVELFQKFRRGDSSSVREFKGTGLGLYISRRIAHLLGGDVKVESELGRGSQFEVTISCPVAKPAETVDAGIGSKFSNHTTGDIEIVVVDDLQANLHLVRAFLQKIGYECRTYLDADTAMAALEEEPADIIFTDVEMPKTNGLEFTRTLRERGISSPANGEPSYIIAMTAGVLPEDRQRCFDAGMDSYIAKPFQIDDLSAVIALAS